MKVLSIEPHLSVYLALKYGLISTAVNRNTRKKSSRISRRRDSLNGVLNGLNPHYTERHRTVRLDAASDIVSENFPNPADSSFVFSKRLKILQTACLKACLKACGARL